MLVFRDYDGNAHTEAWFDAFDEAIDSDGLFEPEARGETCAYPERIRRLNEHPVGADIARAPADERRAPFDLEVGVKCIAWRPAALQPSRMVRVAHRPVEPLLRIPACSARAVSPGLES